MVDKQPKPPNIKIHKSVGSIPPFNLKSTIVPCTGTPYVFLYGGFDEYDALDGNVYILNTSTMEWEIDDKEDGLYREGHSAIYIGNGNVLIFGGLPFEDEVSNQPPPPPPPQPQPAAPTARHALRSSVLTPENNRQNINGLTNFGSNYLKKDSLMMIYNVIDKKWIGPPDFALENCPSSRSRHACCLSEDGSKLYISGGMVKSTPLNDLYCYDLVQGTWSGPMEFVFRFDHTIMVYQDKIFAFGGLEKDMNHVKSISYYSLKTKTVGEILIHDQANNKNVASHRPPVIFDMMVLNSKINHAVNLMISFPALIPSTGIEISSFNVNDFETQKLFDHHNLLHYFRNINMNDFFWKTAFITHEESLYFLGTRRRENKRGESHFGDFLPETTSEDNDVDQEQQQQQQQEGEIDEDLEYEYADETELRKLNHVLEIKLSYLGIPSQTEDLFFSDFHKLLLQQEFTDFEIISLATNDKDEKRFFGNTSEESEYETRSIPVHKTILLARWPHFYRMLTSGMNEAIENKMFIPEPFIRVKALVYYLYMGSINFDNNFIHENELTLVDYSGLLVLANMYELKELLGLVLEKLLKMFTIFELNFINCTDIDNNDENVYVLLKIWKDLTFSLNDSVFFNMVILLIKKKWSIITRSKIFASLCKEDIVKLCQDSTDEFSPSPPLHRPLNLHKSPNGGNHSVDTLELLLYTPTRNTNSPFIIDSPANQPTIFNTLD